MKTITRTIWIVLFVWIVALILGTVISELVFAAPPDEEFPGFGEPSIGISQERWETTAHPPEGWGIVRVTTNTKWLEVHCYQQSGQVLHKDIADENGIMCTSDYSIGRKTRFTRFQFVSEDEAERLCASVWDGHLLKYPIIVRQGVPNETTGAPDPTKRGIGQEMFMCAFKTLRGIMPKMIPENEGPVPCDISKTCKST